jgi:hypothetical protein
MGTLRAGGWSQEYKPDQNKKTAVTNRFKKCSDFHCVLDVGDDGIRMARRERPERRGLQGSA